MRKIACGFLFATALLAEPSPAAAAIECQARPGGDGSYWAWRQVDGRRCYYKGRRGKDKTLLAWPAARAEPPPRIASVAPPPPPPPPPPARIAAAAPAPPAMAPVAVPRVVDVPVRIVGQALPPPPPKAAPPFHLKGDVRPSPAPASPWGIGALVVIAITGAAAFLVSRRRLRRLEIGS